MVLAAGLGSRMRPLTDRLPKPLLTVAGKPLIDWHLEKLAQAGFNQVLINLAYLGPLIRQHCGDGSRYGLVIDYSDEGPEPLETGGALNLALPWFGQQAFALISADVFSDLDYRQLAARMPTFSDSDNQAELILVDNPPHHPRGDFALTGNKICAPTETNLTYSGIALVKPALIGQFPGRCQRFPLRDALAHWRELGQLSGWHYPGQWSDVGTPERLAELNGTQS